jgi:hypothetical protein
MLGIIWSVVGDNRHSDALQKHWIARNTFRISKNTFLDPDISDNSLNVFQWQFHHRYFRHATSHQCERGISI